MLSVVTLVDLILANVKLDILEMAKPAAVCMLLFFLFLSSCCCLFCLFDCFFVLFLFSFCFFFCSVVVQTSFPLFYIFNLLMTRNLLFEESHKDWSVNILTLYKHLVSTRKHVFPLLICSLNLALVVLDNRRRAVIYP